LRGAVYDGAMTTSCSWVALGDSFTSGVGDDPDEGGWVARAARALSAGGRPIELHNHAVRGEVVSAVLEQQVPLLPASATIVSAIAGANDLLEYRYRPAELAAQVRQLVHAAAAAGELVLTSTCPDFFAHRYGPGSKLTRRIDALNAAVADAVRDAVGTVLVLDTHAVLLDASLWDVDGIHPNPTGHQLLADHAVALIEPLLTLAPAMATGSAVAHRHENGCRPPVARLCDDSVNHEPLTRPPSRR